MFTLQQYSQVVLNYLIQVNGYITAVLPCVHFIHATPRSVIRHDKAVVIFNVQCRKSVLVFLLAGHHRQTLKSALKVGKFLLRPEMINNMHELISYFLPK